MVFNHAYRFCPSLLAFATNTKHPHFVPPIAPYYHYLPLLPNTHLFFNSPSLSLLVAFMTRYGEAWSIQPTAAVAAARKERAQSKKKKKKNQFGGGGGGGGGDSEDDSRFAVLLTTVMGIDIRVLMIDAGR
jgi:hypothetical protein